MLVNQMFQNMIMKYDTQTKEIYLESKDGKTQIPTGLIHKS